VPVDFLSGRDMAAYGRYVEPPSAAQLERFFHYEERDRALIDRRRGEHNRLGFAVQLGTVRFLGTFLARPTDVPDVVANRVAEELGIADPGRLAAYAKREPTHREHAGEIQRVYGYRDFSEASAQAELSGWLDARAWATAERPSVLFDLATARLIDAKVLLPGASVLARTVASARDRAADRLHRTLAEAAIDKRHRLEQLLQVADEERLSGLEVLRAGPRKLTASEAAEAFERLAAICAVGVGDITVDVPVGRLRALARYGLAAKAQTLRRLRSDRRTATLFAALWQLEHDATDDALILLDRVTGLLVSHAAREHKDRRYAQLPTWTAPLVACVPLCSCSWTHQQAASRSCGTRSAATSVAQSFNWPLPPCTSSPPDPTPTTARTLRSAVSFCAVTRASGASSLRCFKPSPSTLPRLAGRCLRRLSRCGPWKADPAASAPARSR